MPAPDIPELVQIHDTPLWEGTCVDCTRYYRDNAEELLFYLWHEATGTHRPYTIDDGLIMFFETHHENCLKGNNEN